MITVEELIVQSLYHRLVLITVRRTSPPSESNGDGQAEAERTGESSGSGGAIVTANGSELTSQGLGYLYLGSLPSLPNSAGRVEEISTDAGVLERESSPVATVTLDEQPSAAIVRSLRADDQVAFKTRVINMMDVTSMNAIQRLLKSAEVQTDFEPMWCVGKSLFPSSLSESSNEMPAVVSAALSPGSGPLIDLRSCNQFSVIHLENLQDPDAQSLVMVNTNEIGAPEIGNSQTRLTYSERKKLKENVEGESCDDRSAQPFGAMSERLSSQGALFVEDSQGHLKREMFQESNARSQNHGQSQDVDSGIWDMMQALESGGNTQIFSENMTNHAGTPSKVKSNGAMAEGLSTLSDELQGTYKMFTVPEKSTNGSTSNEISLDGKRSEGARDVREGEVLLKDGGLSDALKPATAVNFVIHRVETDSVQTETVENGALKLSPKKEKYLRKRDRMGMQKNVTGNYRRARSLKVRKPSKIVCQTCHKCKSKTKECEKSKPEGVDQNENTANGDEFTRLCQDVQRLVHQSDLEQKESHCTCPNAIYNRELIGEDVEQEPENYKDVIKVTSLEIGRRGHFTGSTQNLSETNRQFHPWEIVVPPRRSQSERSSPMSSVADLQSLCHPARQNLEKKRLLARSAHASPTRRSLPLSVPPNDAVLQHFATTETPNAPFPDDLTCSTPGGQGSGEWGSGQWSTGTADSMSTINVTCEPETLQFEKFPDWMKKLPTELHAVPISELCIPGSHIALAIEKDMKIDWDFSRCNYEMAEFLRKLPNLPVFNNFRDHMKSIWKAWMPKQWLSIHDQLVAGSRYLDLRITKHNEVIYGEHGLYTRQLKKYLKEVRLFIEEQPSEVIILHFQSCEYLNRSDKRHLLMMLFQIFGGKMVCKSENRTLPSLEWMWSVKKQLLILFPEVDMELIKNHIFGGLVWSDEVVAVTTPKKQTVAQLVDYLEESVSKRSPNDISRLFVCKAVLSPDMSTVFGKFQYRCMRELVSCELSSAVSCWLDGKTQLNVVAVDFVGIGNTVEKILALNVRRK